MSDRDTIIAPATSVGNAGIAIVRISGTASLSFLQRHFRATSGVSNFVSHQLYLGRLVDTSAEVIDEIMAVHMHAPRSYTCEDVVEIHCHGSRQVVKIILDLAITHGIRLAKPGEFTYRAYLNGRLDLTQAEAVSRLIHSKSEFSRKAALQQLDGLLSRRIYTFSARIKQFLVMLEAWIDFPEEDLPEENIIHISESMKKLLVEMETLANSYRAGQRVHDGVTVVLVGLPNVGKSSLLNAFLEEERAIVSAIPGTTRDLIEQSIDIGGLTVRLVDTAGLRETEDYVEREGVRKAHDKLKSADLVLLLMDGTESPGEEFLNLFHLCKPYPSILVITKSDLAGSQHGIDTSFFTGPIFSVSAKHGTGLDILKQYIVDSLYKDHIPDAEPAYLTERRHFESLVCAVDSTRSFLQNIDQTPVDLLAIDLRDALHHLAAITGEVTTNSILDDVFSQFCIGK